MKNVHFVFFHVFKAGPDASLDLIEMAVDSVARHYPEAAITLISNASSADLQHPDRVSMRATVADPGRLMLSRIVAYDAFLQDAPEDGHVVFLDTDILIVRRFDELLSGDADLTVTVRNWRDEPINGGFYIVNLANRKPVLDFFAAFVADFRNLDAEKREWSGDQISLQRLLQAPRLRFGRPILRMVRDLRVKYVSKRLYNHTPRPWALALGLFRPFARVLHFKGARKLAMKRYHKRFIAKTA